LDAGCNINLDCTALVPCTRADVQFLIGPVRLTIAAVYVSKSTVIKRAGSLDRFHPSTAGEVEVSSN
jgi:hypothetical protein